MRRPEPMAVSLLLVILVVLAGARSSVTAAPVVPAASNAKTGFVFGCFVPRTERRLPPGFAQPADDCPALSRGYLGLGHVADGWQGYLEFDPATPPVASWRDQPGWQNWGAQDVQRPLLGYRWLADYYVVRELGSNDLRFGAGRHHGGEFAPWDGLLPGALWFPHAGWAQTALWLDGVWVRPNSIRAAARIYLGGGEGAELQPNSGSSFGTEVKISLDGSDAAALFVGYASDRQQGPIAEWRHLKVRMQQWPRRSLERWSAGLGLDGKWDRARGLIIKAGFVHEQQEFTASSLAEQPSSAGLFEQGVLPWESLVNPLTTAGQAGGAKHQTKYLSWSYRILDTYVVGSSWEWRQLQGQLLGASGTTDAAVPAWFPSLTQQAWAVGVGVDHRRGWQVLGGWRQQVTRGGEESIEMPLVSSRRLQGFLLKIGYHRVFSL